jgi:membrane peptidoglycan carboxypeptidase
MVASSGERQRVYRWLFKAGRKYAQDRRIQALLEIEAFTELHHAWQRLGYPFETLTPSYASAIGASGDRPAALAELIGLLLNDGVQAPRLRFDSYHFAAGTPYETRLARPPARGAHLLAPEVAAATRGALIEVVETGTARRLQGVYQRPGQPPLRVGGKTGTGDHRRVSYGAHGHLVGTQVVSRAATFAFFLGEHFFGVVTAYVTGPEAARYHFTSALPVQVLKGLAPILMPFLTRAPEEQDRSVRDSASPRTTVLSPTADKPAEEATTQVRPKSTRTSTITRMRPRPPLG